MKRGFLNFNYNDITLKAYQTPDKLPEQKIYSKSAQRKQAEKAIKILKRHEKLGYITDLTIHGSFENGYKISWVVI